MRYSVEKHIAVVGALLITVAILFSCGQLSLVEHGIVSLPGFSECSETSSVASAASATRDFLDPLGGLLLLLALASLVSRKLVWSFISTPPDPSPRTLLLPKRIQPTMGNDLQEAFRRGIIHPRLYD
jgi:hypothetical protein